MSDPAATPLSDGELVAGFEACTLAAFPHADHVRLAWIYLREQPLLVALERFTSGLRRFAAHHGVPGKYHETITWAYLLLIHERMAGEADFATFRGANPDLFDGPPSVLERRYYRSATLASERARAVFVLPDLGAP